MSTDRGRIEMTPKHSIAGRIGKRSAGNVMKRFFILAVASLALIAPITVYAQASEQAEGVLFRLDGNIALGPGETVDSVVTLSGDALIEGAANTVTVVNGTATLSGAQVDDLIVISGQAVLQPGTRIAGDVRVWDSELVQAEDVIISGQVYRDASIYPWLSGWLFAVGVILFLGVSLMLLVAGAIAAVVAGAQVRAAVNAIQTQIGWSVLAAIALWFLLPALAAFIFITLIGIPSALVVFFFLMPALWFLGYIIAGVWTGYQAMRLVKKGRTLSERPYVEAIVGLLILQVIALVPFVGMIVTPIAGLIGGGAIVLVAAQSAFRPTERREMAAQPRVERA
jgi:hypothetical protein